LWLGLDVEIAKQGKRVSPNAADGYWTLGVFMRALRDCVFDATKPKMIGAGYKLSGWARRNSIFAPAGTTNSPLDTGIFFRPLGEPL
jgi:hypothetical protein